MTTFSAFDTDLRRVIIERINDRFSYGQYGEFRIILMNDNGYVNATKLCSGSKKHPNKRFRDWVRYEIAKELIEEVKKEITSGARTLAPDDPCEKRVLIKIFGEIKGNNTRGIYVHPLLVPHITSWYDSSFAIKVSKIVSSFSVREFERRLAAKDDIITELRSELHYIRTSTDQIIRDNITTHEKLDTTHKKLDQVIDEKSDIQFILEETKDEIVTINDKLDDTKQSLDRVQNKLDIAVIDRVPEQKYPSKNEQFYLLKPLPKKDDARYDYYVIRGQRDYIIGRLGKIMNDFPLTQTLLSIDYQPNSRNLYHRLRQNKKDKMFSKLNWFSLKDWNEEDMINTIQCLNDDKYNVYES